MIKFQVNKKLKTDIIIVLCTQDYLLKSKAENKKLVSLGISRELLIMKGFKAEANEILPVFSKKKDFCLVGLGKQKDLSLTGLRVILRKSLKSIQIARAKSVGIILHQESDADVQAVIEAVLLGGYSWDKYKSKKSENTLLGKGYVIFAPKKEKYFDTISICQGTNLARDLVNENADVATSSFIEKEIRKIIAGQKKFSIKVLNKKEMKKEGLGFHLEVNKGSANEPKLVIVSYRGESSDQKFTALVGKGLTFDTGGLNLKSSGHIETMRMDMAGCAAVVGTLKNIVALQPKKNILFVCGLAENVTGSKAYKPGDVIVGYARKSVEVANTDAEGRLVLADAISYTIKNYKPKEIIDVATLTGACVVALGCDYTGLMSNNDSLAQKLLASGEKTDDRLWQLPMYLELKDSIKSEIADIRNLGFPQGAAGAMTAAEFLRQFTEKTNWAHLDIAGTGFVESGERMYFGHGATGSGVRLLTHFLT